VFVYRDPTNPGRVIRAPERLNPDDLDEIFGGGGGGGAAPSYGPGATTTTRTTTEQGRPSYILRRGREFAESAARLTVPPRSLEDVGHKAWDVLNVGGPIVAATTPIGAAGVAGGLLAGEAATEAGWEQPELADVAVNAATAVPAAIGGVVRGARAAADITEEGAQLRALRPGMRGLIQTAREQRYDPIVAGLQNTGRTLRQGTPEGDQVVRQLLEARQDWGENRAMRRILGHFIQTGEADADQLDSALRIANATGRNFATRGALRLGLEHLARGTPYEGELTAAGRWFDATLVPAQELAKAAGRKTPGAAALAVIRTWNNLPAASRALIDPTGEIAGLVRSGQRGARGAMALAGGLGAMGGAALATQRFLQGDYKGGFRMLLGAAPMAALRYPGIVGAGARGAVAPAARGAAGALGALISPEIGQPGGAPAATSNEELPGGAGDLGPADLGAAEDNLATLEPSAAPRAAAPPRGAPRDDIAAAARLVGIPEDFYRVVIAQESGGNVHALSHPAPGKAPRTAAPSPAPGPQSSAPRYPAGGLWADNLRQRVAAGWITPEQADEQMRME
jgi:hypothetical protein